VVSEFQTIFSVFENTVYSQFKFKLKKFPITGDSGNEVDKGTNFRRSMVSSEGAVMESTTLATGGNYAGEGWKR
jgi:hypothetical protein